MYGLLMILGAVTLTYGRHQDHVARVICTDSAQKKIPHGKDCTKFYYCDVNRVQTLGNCAPGKEFSYKLQKCTEPRLAKCDHHTENSRRLKKEPRALLSNGCSVDGYLELLPHETNCSLFYYCVSGEKVLKECGNGTHFNNDIKVCDYPENVKCNEENGDIKVGQVRAIANVGRSIQVGNMLPNGCPNYNVHFLLPHETDCSKFYYCISGAKVERDCAPGTHFNPTIQVCDWPGNANCQRIGDNNNGGNQGILPNGCPANFSIQALLPHETNCSKFYNCEFGNKILRNCPLGTHFNPKLQVCDWPWNAGCVDGTGNGGNGGILPNGCPTDFTIHLLLKHERNCSKFYYCVFGDKVERDCAPGTHFNPKLQVCDWPWHAGCTNAVSNGILPNGCPLDFSIHKLLSHETNCSKFYSCDFGNKVERDCAPGTHFNSKLQVCDWPWHAGCSGSGGGNGFLPNGCPADYSVTQLLPHEWSCNKFYYCVFGNKVQRDCAPGTHFNPRLQVCDWPWHAGCEPGGGIQPNGCPSDYTIHKLLPHEQNCSKFYYCSFGNKVESNCAAGTQFNPKLQVCDWPWHAGCSGGNPNGVLSNGCPADFSVHKLLPHQWNCSKFYQCAFGNKVERNCAPGTHFNNKLQVCDWPSRAGCKHYGGGLLPNGCPSDFNRLKLLRHEWNCSKYYLCSFGEKEERECAPGTHYNSKLQICDWPWHAGCDKGGSNVLPNGCPTNFTIHQLLPHESDCRKFYYCVFGDKVERDCPWGQHFNPTLQVCDWPGLAGCKLTPTPGEGCGTCGGNWCSNCTVWPHETDCDKYWKCVGGKKVKAVCPEGLNFNTKTQTCDFVCNVGCVRRGIQSTARDDGLSIFLPWDKVDSIIDFSKGFLN